VETAVLAEPDAAELPDPVMMTAAPSAADTAGTDSSRAAASGIGSSLPNSR